MPGYYRYPTIANDTVVFTSEDDLWSVPAGGGIARRLTANLGTISFPSFSPDGSTLAFTGREEGQNEVYTMPADGGPVKRVTFLGVSSSVMGWSPDGADILFGSDHGQPFTRTSAVFAVSPEGGLPRQLPVGPATSISIASGNRIALGRNNADSARWKRYRGGTAGDLWADAEGSGRFRRLIELKGNLARPMWIGDRIFFISDHDGIANIYSCSPLGVNVQQHTHHADYYVRFPSTDGRRIVYHAGADLYIYDPASDVTAKVEVAYHSPRVHRQRRFVDAARYLDSFAVHPEGHSLAITTRGKSFTCGNWEGPVTQQGGDDPGASIRYRMTRWLNDGKRVVTVSDAAGEEALEVRYAREEDAPVLLHSLDIGHPIEMRVSPTEDQVIIANHRNELMFVDLVSRTAQVVDRSPFRTVQGFGWSPDGRWVAYGFSETQYTTAIKLWDRTSGQTHLVTEPVLHDTEPSFDPEGKFLYFIGARELNPVYDNLHFDLGFPNGTRPYLITLRAETESPFVPKPHPLTEAHKTKEERERENGAKEDTDEEEDADEARTQEPERHEPCVIDFEGIQERVVAFPVADGRYGQVSGIKGKALFTTFPVEGAISVEGAPEGPRGVIELYDFKEQKRETLAGKVSDFILSRDSKTLIYRSGRKLRAITAGAKPDDRAGSDPSRKSGWIDLGRVRVSVEPGVEWRQMAREAWRLQREHFWTADMSQVDWSAIWERYAPLVDRVGTRGEFSDLMWEMQGELGTSHAYEMGGDYRSEPSYPQGFLGADIVLEGDTYRIGHIVRGAAGEPSASSPLRAPGAGISEGDAVLAINGRKLSRTLSPQEMLVHQAGAEVALTVAGKDGTHRNVTIKALRSEFPARYREWVETNRRFVHEATGGRVGYVHVPDMGGYGYSEFHRLFLAEVDRDGLIVDVRFNRGGHVSQLIIEKLARKRVGYDIQRWGQPEPYPSFSVAGPMVALTNQFAGSDGDIFSHVFKLMKLGTLIGKRTWGGVVGIWPRTPLADGSITTQPEFSFWFMDVGWGVENYGTDPDIDIDVAPQDYGSGYDPQMAKAIEVILRRLDEEPPLKPTFDARPNLAFGG